jgi:hypothetical protein
MKKSIINAAAKFICNYVQPATREAYELGFEEGIIWYQDRDISRIPELEIQISMLQAEVKLKRQLIRLLLWIISFAVLGMLLMYLLLTGI